VQPGRIEGLRFLPHRVTWQAMLYDQRVLGAPPRTWAELLAVALAHPGRIGIKGASYEGLTCDLLPFVVGGRRTRRRLRRRRGARRLRPVRTAGARAEPAELDLPRGERRRGDGARRDRAPPELALRHGALREGLAPTPIRSAPIPAGPAGTATVLGGGYLAIPRGARQREPAQSELHRRLGWFSARRDVAAGDGDGLLAGFTAMRGAVRARPELADYPRLSRLRALQQRLRVTTLYVTHDQAEAMTLGDRVVVMRDGRIQQADTPSATYERPANAFVAGFVGTPPMNLLPAVRTVIGVRVGEQQIALPPDVRPRASDPDGRLLVGVRPEAFGPRAPGGLDAVIDSATCEILGSETLVRGTVGREPVTARLPGVVRDLPRELTAPPDALHFFTADAAGTRL
jgi:hypothetical protein